MANGICCEAQTKGPLPKPCMYCCVWLLGLLSVVVVCEWTVNKATSGHVFADGLWSREAPQVIVVVPHFLSLQAVTQPERCDRGNVAGEAGKKRAN